MARNPGVVGFIWEDTVEDAMEEYAWDGWLDGHPDMNNNDETCVVLLANGKWREKNCGGNFIGLCEHALP